MQRTTVPWKDAPPDGSGTAARPLDTFVVAAVFALALGLRLLRLDAQSLWIDEAASLGFATAPWAVLWRDLAPFETNPLGYYALLKLWIAVAGTSEFALRLPSAIASALCVVPLYWLSLRLFDRRTAVLAVLLLALAAMHVRYAQEARSYAIFFLVYLCALAVAARLADAKIWRQFAWRDVALFGLLGAGLIHLHATGPIALASVNMYVLAVLATRRAPWAPVLMPLIAANLLAVVLSLPALLTMWAQMQDPGSAVAWIERPTLASAASLYLRVLGHGQLVSFRPWADAIFGLGLIAAAWCAVRRGESRTLGLLAALGFVLAVLYGLSLKKPILLPRTALFALALALPLIAYGLTRMRRRWVLAAIVAAAVLPQAKGLANYYAYGAAKERWRDVTAAAAAASGPGTALVIAGDGEFGALALAYYWPRGEPMPPMFVLAQPTKKLQEILTAHTSAATMILPETVCPDLSGHDRIVVIARETASRPRTEELRQALTAHGANAVAPTAYPPGLDLQHWSGLACGGAG